jgi:protein-tyrosine phosphatase
MFKSLFSKFQPKIAPIDFSTAVADMHSHLIPGIDDGARTIEDSVELVRSLHELGFKKIITTPHIMSDYYKNTPAIIMEGLELVKEAVRKENISIELCAAAEYYVDDGFVKKLETEKLLTLGDNYLLFEISYINCPENINEIIFRMQVLGYKPIMAHPERYPFWYNNFDQYRHYRDSGVLLQLNTNSLCGYYGYEAKKIAEKLIDQEMVDLIGTDTHHTRHIAALQKCTTERYTQKVLGFNLLNKHL